ncbi:MAG: hypothetical protein IPO59_06525 [Betaproteobacteria bacterium]|nr:hypothetical protein [Betaproteobacteria bacterium]
MKTENEAVAAAPDPAAAQTRGDAPGDRAAPAALDAAAARVTPGARRRRPEPARTAPHRHAATLLRASVPPAAETAGAWADAATLADADAAHAEGPVALGVRLGYQVIEEQILLGQKLARRLGRKASQAVGGAGAAWAAGGAASAAESTPTAGAAPAAAGAGTAGEFNELLDRVLHLYKDLGALCFDAVETVARNPVLRAGVARLASGAAVAAAARTGGGTSAEAAYAGADAEAPGSGFAVDIRCSRRVQVRLDLRLRQGQGAPLVHALHAGDPAVPPLTGVHLQPGTPHAGPLLQLTIADTQPAATYTGVVVDSTSNEPRGTLVVRVLPPGA